MRVAVLLCLALVLLASTALGCNKGEKQADTDDCHFKLCNEAGSWDTQDCPKKYFKQTHFNEKTKECEYRFFAWSCKPTVAANK